MIKTVNEMKIRTNGDKMHQTDRNNLRIKLIQKVKEMLEQNQIECDYTADGLTLNIPHDDLGSINCIIDLRMKNLDFDFDFEVEDFKNVINEVDSLPEEPLFSEQPEPEYIVQDYTSTVNKKVKKRFNVVAVQFAIIGVLLATILLTNAFMPNSALNVFMKNVFGGQEETMQTVDNRVFSDFTPVMQSNAEKILYKNCV